MQAFMADESYNYNLFSEDLGLGFGNVSWLIIHGKRKMTLQSAAKITSALALPDKQKRYLKALVSYNNSKDIEKRQTYLDQLIGLRSQVAKGDEERFVLDFYSHWSHAVIFEMVGLESFESDPDWISNMLHTKLSKKQIQESLSLLERLKLIQFDETRNRHVKLVEDFESPATVPGIGVMQFHLKMIELGMEALEQVPPDSRDFSALTLAISEKGRDAIKEELAAFRKYLMFIASKYPEKDQLVELNFQMFNLTKSVSEGGK